MRSRSDSGRALPARHRRDDGGGGIPKPTSSSTTSPSRVVTPRSPAPARAFEIVDQRSLNGTYCQRRARRPRVLSERLRGARRQVPPQLLRLAGRPAAGGGRLSAARRRPRTFIVRGACSASARCSRGCQPEFPDLTSSKLRFLEVQGIVIARAHRVGLSQVLARPTSSDCASRSPCSATTTCRSTSSASTSTTSTPAATRRCPERPAPPSIVPAPRRYRREELLAAAGAAPQLLNDAISTRRDRRRRRLQRPGARGPAGAGRTRSVTASSRATCAGSAAGAEREVALVETALSRRARRTDAAARATCERARARARRAARRGARERSSAPRSTACCPDATRLDPRHAGPFGADVVAGGPGLI